MVAAAPAAATVTRVTGRPFDDDDMEAVMAFARAEHARQYRVQVVAQLELGVIELAGLFDLDRDDHRVGSIKMVYLLQALPGVGKVAARKALERLGLDDNVRVGQLDDRVRRSLMDTLARQPSAEAP